MGGPNPGGTAGVTSARGPQAMGVFERWDPFMYLLGGGGGGGGVIENLAQGRELVLA